MLAGDDKDSLATLSRFKSSGDFLKTFTEAQATIRSGKHKEATALSDQPTDEELATYRKENGIPGDPKGYLEGLPDGLVFGEQDEGILNSFLERAHAANRSPEQVRDVLDWYANEMIPEQAAAQKVADDSNRQTTNEELREAWGSDYKANLNTGLNFLKSTGPVDDEGNSTADLILNARLGDGTLAGDNKHFLDWITGMALEANPAGFIAPGSGLTNEQSIENEITEIEGLMRSDPPTYFKDNAKQERLRTLYDARAKFGTQKAS